MQKKQSPEKKVEQKLEWASEHYADFIASAFAQAEQIIRRNLNRDPHLSNQLMKEIGTVPNVQSVDDIIKMIKKPYMYERELRQLSRYLEYAVMAYNRIVDHFTKILLYNHELQPLTPPPAKSEQIQTYLNGRTRCIDWLRKFRAREKFEGVTKSIIEDGAKFIYVRQSGEYIDLQEMPIDYCKITGRTNLGFTYSFDMSFFDRWGNVALYAPEFAEWYKEVMDLRKKGVVVDTWYPMPPDKAFVFTFDDAEPFALPPLVGVFGDAVQINEYKNILKARAILDVFAILYQEIPLDKEGKTPVISAKDATRITAAIEQALPAGAHTVASPNKPSLFTFSKSSGDKTIIPSGEEEFYRTSGVSGQQYGGGDKGAVAQKYSNISDYGYVRQLYYQYERFINYMLSKVSAQYRFGVFFHGNMYTNQDDIKSYMTAVDKGAPVSRLFAMYGYDPGQAENCLMDEQIVGIKQIMIPPSNTNQPIGTQDAGRPSKSLENLTPTGEAMREEAGSGAEAL